MVAASPEVDEGPRREFFYWSDDGDLMAIRYNHWKLSFKTVEKNLFRGYKASTNVPLVTNLRADPWEKYQTESEMYTRWWGEKLWTVLPAAVMTGKYLATFKDYPPSQAGGSFGIEQILQKVKAGFAAGTK